MAAGRYECIYTHSEVKTFGGLPGVKKCTKESTSLQEKHQGQMDILQKSGKPPVKDMFTDLRDGRKLLDLLEGLTGTSLVELVNIGGTDIVDGNHKLTLGLIWNIILHWQVKDVMKDIMSNLQQTNSEKILLSWVRQCTRSYDQVNVLNFTSSWTDGLAFNAIIHKFKPGLFRWENVVQMTPAERLENAFSLARLHLGIERLLDPEDVAVQLPDKKSIIMYVTSLFEVLPKDVTIDDIREVESLPRRYKIDCGEGQFYSQQGTTSEEETGSSRAETPSTVTEIEVDLDSYQMTLEEVLTWLLSAEDTLHMQDEISEDVEEVKEQFHTHEAFMMELTAHQSSVGNVLQAGNQLIAQGSLTEEEENEIREQMTLLNARWEGLRVDSMDRQASLHEVLMELQQQQLQQLSDWLTETEARIHKMESEPMAEDMESYQKQIELHKVLQNDLEIEQVRVNSLTHMVVVVDENNGESATAALEEQLQSLGERWAAVCRWTEERWRKLQDILLVWQQFIEDQNLKEDMEMKRKTLDQLGDAGQDVSQLLNSGKFSQSLHREMEEMSQSFYQLLINTEAIPGEEVRNTLEHISVEWKDIGKQVQDCREKIQHQEKINTFYSELKKLEYVVKEKQEWLNSASTQGLRELSSRNLKESYESHVKQLLTLKPRIEELQAEADELAGVHSIHFAQKDLGAFITNYKEILNLGQNKQQQLNSDLATLPTQELQDSIKNLGYFLEEAEKELTMLQSTVQNQETLENSVRNIQTIFDKLEQQKPVLERLRSQGPGDLAKEYEQVQSLWSAVKSRTNTVLEMMQELKTRLSEFENNGEIVQTWIDKVESSLTKGSLPLDDSEMLQRELDQCKILSHHDQLSENQEKAENLKKDLAEMQEWMTQVDEEYLMRDFEYKSPDELEGALDEMKRAKEDVLQKEVRVKILKDNINTLVAKSPPGGQNLTSDLAVVLKNYQKLCERFQRKCHTLEEVWSCWIELLHYLEMETNWLNDLEEQVQNTENLPDNPGIVAEALENLESVLRHPADNRTQIRELGQTLIDGGILDEIISEKLETFNARYEELSHQNIHAEIAAHEATLEELRRKNVGNFPPATQEGKSPRGGTMLDVLQRKLREISTKYQLFQKPANFEQRMLDCKRVLDSAKNELHVLDVKGVEPDEIQTHLDGCMKLYKLLSEVKLEVETVIKTGRQIVQKQQTDNPKAMDEQLTVLKLLYNDLGAQVTEGKQDLEKALHLAQKIQKETTTLDDWLKESEAVLSRKTTSEDMPAEIEAEVSWTKGLLKELDRKKADITNITKGSAALQSLLEVSVSQLEEHLCDLNRDWEQVHSLAEDWLNTLLKHENEMEIFDENLAHISTWLYQTEIKLDETEKQSPNEKDKVIKVMNLLSELEVITLRVDSVRDQAIILMTSRGSASRDVVEPKLADLNHNFAKVSQHIKATKMAGGTASSTYDFNLKQDGKTEISPSEMFIVSEREIKNIFKNLDKRLVCLEQLAEDDEKLDEEKAQIEEMLQTCELIYEQTTDYAKKEEISRNLLQLQNKYSMLRHLPERYIPDFELSLYPSDYLLEINKVLLAMADVELMINLPELTSRIYENFSSQEDTLKNIKDNLEKLGEQVAVIHEKHPDVIFEASKSEVVQIGDALVQLNSEWDRVNRMYHDRKGSFDKSVEEWRQFHCDLNDLTQWVTEAEQMLANGYTKDGLLDIKQAKLNQQELEDGLASHQSVYLALNQTGDGIIGRLSAPDSNLLQEKINGLNKRWKTVAQEVSKELFDKVGEVEANLQNRTLFQDKINHLSDWVISEREKLILKSQIPVAATELQILEAKMKEHKVEMEDVLSRSIELQKRQQLSPQDKNKVEQLATDWKALDLAIKEVSLQPVVNWRLQVSPQRLTAPNIPVNTLMSSDVAYHNVQNLELLGPADLNKTATELADWLILIDQMLKSNIVTVGDIDEIKTTIGRLKITKNDLEQRHSHLEDIFTLAQNIKNKTSNEDIRTSITDKLERVRTQWDSTQNGVEARLQQLDQMVIDSIQWTDQKAAVETLIDQSDVHFQNLIQQSGEPLMKQLALIQMFLQDLNKGQITVTAFRNLSDKVLVEYPNDDIRRVKEYADQHTLAWHSLNSRSIEKQNTVDSDLKLLQSSLKELEVFLKWLQEAENKANALADASNKEDLSQDNVHMKMLRNQLEDIQAEIDAHNDIFKNIDSNKNKMVKALGSSDEAVFLQQRLDDMNQRWSELKAKSATIRNNLPNNGLKNKFDIVEGYPVIIGNIKGFSSENELKEKEPAVLNALDQARMFLADQPIEGPEEPRRNLPTKTDLTPEEKAQKIAKAIRKQSVELKEKWDQLNSHSTSWQQQVERALEKLQDLQRVMSNLDSRLSDAESIRSGWQPVGDLLIDSLQDHIDKTTAFREEIDPIQHEIKTVNDLASQLAPLDVQVPLNSSQKLDNLNMRWKYLQVAVEDRLKQLQEAHRDFGPSSQHFLSSK
ncbi:UTRO protein, partial [Polypterus senegalus]